MSNTPTIKLTVDGQAYNSTLGAAYDYASDWGDVELGRRLLGLAIVPAFAGAFTVRIPGERFNSALGDARDYASDVGDADLVGRIDQLLTSLAA